MGNGASAFGSAELEGLRSEVKAAGHCSREGRE